MSTPPMRALLCHAWGTVDDLRLGDVPAPVPAPGEVLIAIIMEKP